jgi:hypothetical protein
MSSVSPLSTCPPWSSARRILKAAAERWDENRSRDETVIIGRRYPNHPG